MAVYTTLSDAEIAEILSRYSINEDFSAQGIKEGIENTNYLIEIKKENRKYILTIFEKRADVLDLPFFFDFTDYLRQRGINSPVAIKDSRGNSLQDIKGKKAALISFLEGSGVTEISKEHLNKLGGYAAKMHLASAGFERSRKNSWGIRAWSNLLEKIGEKANEFEQGLTKLIAEEIYFLADKWPFDLPSGAVHTDLFPDNVFFKDGEISGVIDFYFSCTDFFAYDLAIIINAWCFDKNFKFVPELAETALGSYQKLRPLLAPEAVAMNILLRGAALRFLMTRLYDWFFTPEDAVVTKKDPREYLEKLKHWQSAS